MSGNAQKQKCMKAPWELAGLPPQTPVLLALSGGADSRLLLHLLAEQSVRDGFLPVAAHVNHGIRGEEGNRDRDFCRRICKAYGVELCVLEEDVPALAKAHGRSLEEEAREVRYAYFAKLMQERKIPILVTAHNADDHAETLLFRLARGTGLAGLGGISEVRPFQGGVLVRPLLGMTKREIVDLCSRLSLEYVTDSTNADTAYARNRLRAEVLPVMESLFSGVSVRMGEMSARLREDEEVLSAMAEEFLSTHVAEGKCPVAPLLLQPPAIRRRILTAWLAHECGITLEQVHLDALGNLIAAAVPHSRLSLPGNTTVAIEDEALSVVREAEFSSTPYDLPFCEGACEILDGRWTVWAKKDEPNTKIHNLSTAPYIILSNESAIMEKDLHWRARRAGDRILMGGMHRSVRKLFCEAKLPLEVRASLPLLCMGEEIVWIPFVGARDGVLAKDEEDKGCYVGLFSAKGIKNQTHVNRNTER